MIFSLISWYITRFHTDKLKKAAKAEQLRREREAALHVIAMTWLSSSR